MYVCVHVHVVPCVLLLTVSNMNIKCQTFFFGLLCKMHITVHPLITVSCVHERHQSNTV